MTKMKHKYLKSYQVGFWFSKANSLNKGEKEWVKLYLKKTKITIKLERKKTKSKIVTDFKNKLKKKEFLARFFIIIVRTLSFYLFDSL